MLVALALPAAAAGVDVYVFWRAGCPHCEREIAFLDRLSGANPDIRVHKLEVSRDRANAALMVQTAERLGVEAGSVPLTVIGSRAWVGYLDDASTGREVAARIDECLARGCPDAVPLAPEREAGMPEVLRLPLVGEVRTANLSLPALTALLAAVDGLNPCAMWVLVFLLGLLAGMKDRVRMWLLGGAFVVASALVYLLILGAWLNVLLLAGAVVYVRIGVGVVALAGSGYYLKEFLTNADMKCEVTAPERRRRVLVAALKTLEVSGLTTRYARWSNAIGGAALLAIGALLVFRPEWLAFA